MAMTLAESFPKSNGWRVDILATDLSTRVLASAAEGVWPVAKAKEIPTTYLKRFMLRGTGSRLGTMKAGAELRELIRFQRLNLNDEDYPVGGPFDLILCRNVLIYFDQRSRRRVIERLIDRLAPGGLLFVGHAESLSNVTERVVYLAPTIYRNPADQRQPTQSNYARQEQPPTGFRCKL
jgi:chemotaxis protein methyltransferase CheR